MNGPAVNNVESLDILLYDGTRMTVGWISEAEWRQPHGGDGREAEIYAKLMSLRQRYQALIESRYPKIVRRISGYNLDQLIPNEKGMVNIARVSDRQRRDLRHDPRSQGHAGLQPARARFSCARLSGRLSRRRSRDGSLAVSSRSPWRESITGFTKTFRKKADCTASI